MADLAGIAPLDLHHPRPGPRRGQHDSRTAGTMLTEAIQQWGGTGSAIALLGATVWMVFTGRLVPRRVHEQALAAERARGDDWREVARVEAARNEVMGKQMGEILTALPKGSRGAA